jgi:hypothetical protein
MNYLTKILLALVAIFILSMVFLSVFDSLDIDYATYGPFASWLYALILFAAILPDKSSSIF